MDPIYVTGHRNPDTDSIVAAMAYAALGNEAETEKYFDMAVSAGQDAKTLQSACNHYAMQGQTEDAQA